MIYLNAWVNDALRRGVTAANEYGDCDEARLYREVRSAISYPFVGQLIAEKLNADENLDSRRIEFENSVYRDLGVFDAISVHLRDLSAVIRLNDHLIGVDKIGHFFVQGWKYFDIAYLDQDGIQSALRWGDKSESLYFGLYTTGIYSYADLSANFEGMRFWLRLLGTARDPVHRGFFFNRSYVKCVKPFIFFGKRRWVVKRDFRFADYVTGVWDEGVNCSRYRNAEIVRSIAERIRREAQLAGQNYDCPIEPQECARAQRRYRDYAATLLHPLCFAAGEQSAHTELSKKPLADLSAGSLARFRSHAGV